MALARLLSISVPDTCIHKMVSPVTMEYTRVTRMMDVSPWSIKFVPKIKANPSPSPTAVLSNQTKDLEKCLRKTNHCANPINRPMVVTNAVIASADSSSIFPHICVTNGVTASPNGKAALIVRTHRIDIGAIRRSATH